MIIVLSYDMAASVIIFSVTLGKLHRLKQEEDSESVGGTE